MLRDLKTLTLDEAQKIVEHAVIEASKDKGDPVAIAVVGNDGHLIAFAAMDGVMPISVPLAQNKAYTVIVGNRDTIYWEEEPSSFDGRNFNDARFCCFGGGVILQIGGKRFVIGAIGVSGRTSGGDHRIADETRKSLYCGNIVPYK